MREDGIMLLKLYVYVRVYSLERNPVNECTKHTNIIRNCPVTNVPSFMFSGSVPLQNNSNMYVYFCSRMGITVFKIFICGGMSSKITFYGSSHVLAQH